MGILPKDVMGRTYTELQKRAGSVGASAGTHKQSSSCKESMQQMERELQGKIEELRQTVEASDSRAEQMEDLQFLKEKQEYVLRNFPTLESNIVEKLKGAQSNNTREIMAKLEEMERVQKKRNAWTKVLLWLSLLFGMASTGGVVVILLYLADVIAF